MAGCGTDILALGVAWLRDQMQAHASQTVTYSRGLDSVTLCATFGRKLFKLDDGEGGIRMEWTDRDFLIPVASLVLAGNPILPQRGDLIRETVGEWVEVYEVLAPGGEAPWTYSDPYHTVYRIHAKRAATEGPYYA